MTPQSSVSQTLRELAARHAGDYIENCALGWFDGFWDFVTLERARLEAAPSSMVVGISHQRNYCLLAWLREGQPRLDIFIEAKDYRPGARAPWPVSSIYLDDGSPVPPSKLPPPELAAAHAKTLRDCGFTLTSGYWGPHAHRPGSVDFTVLQLSQILDAALCLLP